MLGARRQVETQAISLLDILRHEVFAEGYIGCAAGRPFDDRYGEISQDQWFYERGRLVATAIRARLGRCPRLWVEADQGFVINPQVLSIAGELFIQREAL